MKKLIDITVTVYYDPTDADIIRGFEKQKTAGQTHEEAMDTLALLVYEGVGQLIREEINDNDGFFADVSLPPKR